MKSILSKSKIQPNAANNYQVTSLGKALSILELAIDEGRKSGRH